MHAYITRCYINYSALHTLQTFRSHTHTRTFYTTLFRYIPHIHYTPDILCIPNIYCIANTHYVSLRTIHTGHYNTNILDTHTQTTHLTQTNASDIMHYLRDMTWHQLKFHDMTCVTHMYVTYRLRYSIPLADTLHTMHRRNNYMCMTCIM